MNYKLYLVILLSVVLVFPLFYGCVHSIQQTNDGGYIVDVRNEAAARREASSICGKNNYQLQQIPKERGAYWKFQCRKND